MSTIVQLDTGAEAPRPRRPEWLKVALPQGEGVSAQEMLLDSLRRLDEAVAAQLREC